MESLGCLEKPDTDSPADSTSRRIDRPWPGQAEPAVPFGQRWLVAGMLLAWTPDVPRHLQKSQPEVTVVSDFTHSHSLSSRNNSFTCRCERQRFHPVSFLSLCIFSLLPFPVIAVPASAAKPPPYPQLKSGPNVNSSLGYLCFKALQWECFQILISSAIPMAARFL